ncbi:MAG TPA: acyl carrier protein [Trebonia sp.]
MTEFTSTDLAQLLRECGGEDEGPYEDVLALDEPFEDLGYDSLVLFNVVARIERSHRIRLTDQAVADATTPRALLRLINSKLAVPVGRPGPCAA